MNFNPDPAKLIFNPAKELIFFRKVQMISHTPLLLNKNIVPQTSLKKKKRMLWDSKVKFQWKPKNHFLEN